MVKESKSMRHLRGRLVMGQPGLRLQEFLFFLSGILLSMMIMALTLGIDSLTSPSSNKPKDIIIKQS
jgi:hypothetical protein